MPTKSFEVMKQLQMLAVAAGGPGAIALIPDEKELDLREPNEFDRERIHKAEEKRQRKARKLKEK